MGLFDNSAYANAFNRVQPEPTINPQTLSNITQGIGSSVGNLIGKQKQSGTLTGGLRNANSDATQSRMQLNDVASSGVDSLASKQKSQSNPNSTDTWSKYNEDLTNQALNARQVAGTQDINLSVRKANEVDPLAIRNQVGLLTKTNAANFPYQKYGTESQLLNSSGQGILNSGDIQTYTNAATASTPKQYVSF